MQMNFSFLHFFLRFQNIRIKKNTPQQNNQTNPTKLPNKTTPKHLHKLGILQKNTWFYIHKSPRLCAGSPNNFTQQRLFMSESKARIKPPTLVKSLTDSVFNFRSDMLFSVTVDSAVCVSCDAVTLEAQLILSNATFNLQPEGQHGFHIFSSSHPCITVLRG